MKIRALIVDDEELARRRIREMLAEESDIEIIGECGDGEEAVQQIEANSPDLVFLDIQMPEMNGFEVLETVRADRLPVVLFVTAYDEFALRAFDTHAVDYLLKPFHRPRFQTSLQRARAQVGHRHGLGERLRAMLTTVQPQPHYLERVVVRVGNRIQFVRADEIDWIAAEGNYVRIHAGPQMHLLRETLSRLITQLDPERFLRIHRSIVVNAERVREVQVLGKGSYVVILESGTKLTSSPTFRASISALIGD